MGLYRDWRRRRLLRLAEMDAAAWAAAMADLPLLDGLSEDERRRLRGLALLFLHEKSLEGARELVITPPVARIIALQATLPVLNLDLDWLAGWVSVIVYADEFVVDHEEMDEAGVVHRVHEARSGESWERGPLVLSWSDAEAGSARDGYNVVIHEIAHKLDGLNGIADGFPPLHRGMDHTLWTAAFSDAFERLNRQLDAGEEPVLDPYGAESPAEFFAVTSEWFFELPELLSEHYPAIYRQLRLFYRQDPLARLPGSL